MLCLSYLSGLFTCIQYFLGCMHFSLRVYVRLYVCLFWFFSPGLRTCFDICSLIMFTVEYSARFRWILTNSLLKTSYCIIAFLGTNAYTSATQSTTFFKNDITFWAPHKNAF